MRSTSRHTGFTLVELMLSMAFIGILLIVMTVAIIHVTQLYSKGIAIKSINQAGRDLGASIRRDGTNVGIVNTPIIQPDAGGGLGRLCLGSYSYVWSAADKLNDGSAITYTDANTVPIVLARIPDAGGTYCVQDGGGYRTDVERASSTEVLPTDNGDFALHALTLSRVPDFGEQIQENALYTIRYTIGTNDSNALDGVINTLDRSCKPPSQQDNNFNFCSVNTFELVIRAG